LPNLLLLACALSSWFWCLSHYCRCSWSNWLSWYRNLNIFHRSISLSRFSQCRGGALPRK
jgi:hypothetical protein